MFPDPFTYFKFYKNVHQKPSHTPWRKKILWTKTSSHITKQHHCNSRKYPWQRKISRYPSTKFHKQANTQQAKFMELYIHPKHLFSSSFRIVNSYTRQLPAKKNPKKSKKKQIKIFKKAKKKNQIQDIRILKLLISLFINFTSFFQVTLTKLMCKDS